MVKMIKFVVYIFPQFRQNAKSGPCTTAHVKSHSTQATFHLPFHTYPDPTEEIP